MAVSEKPEPTTPNPPASNLLVRFPQDFGATSGMIYVSYCGLNHGLDRIGEESIEEKTIVEHEETEVLETIDVNLSPANAICASSEKKLSGNHGCTPSPNVEPMKTPALNNRNDQKKAVSGINDVPLSPNNAVKESSEKKLIGNHDRNQSSNLEPIKTPASNNRSDQTKAVPETVDVPLYSTNTVDVSSEKKLIANHGCNKSPNITPVKTPALQDQDEERKAFGNPSKSLLACVRVWLSQRIFSTVRTCQKAMRWVGRRIFRR